MNAYTFYLYDIITDGKIKSEYSSIYEMIPVSVQMDCVPDSLTLKEIDEKIKEQNLKIKEMYFQVASIVMTNITKVFTPMLDQMMIEHINKQTGDYYRFLLDDCFMIMNGVFMMQIKLTDELKIFIDNIILVCLKLLDAMNIEKEIEVKMMVIVDMKGKKYCNFDFRGDYFKCVLDYIDDIHPWISRIGEWLMLLNENLPDNFELNRIIALTTKIHNLSISLDVLNQQVVI